MDEDIVRRTAKVPTLAASTHIPDSNQAVQMTADQSFAVRGEGNVREIGLRPTGHFSYRRNDRRSCKLANRRARCALPEINLVGVVAARGENFAIRRKGQRRRPIRKSLEGIDVPAGGRLPEMDVLI